MKKKILLIEDNQTLSKRLGNILKEQGYEIAAALNSDSAEKQYRTFHPDLILLDIKLNNSRLNGLELLEKLKNETEFSAEVIILSGEATPIDAAKSIQLGAYTFIEKRGDFNKEKFLIDIKNAISLKIFNESMILLKKELDELQQSKIIPFIGNSPAILNIKNKIQRFSKFRTDLLIFGKTGTGKEIVANNLHYSSKEATKPYIKINCSSIPENLLESELFGYVKGAFTGADKDKTGLIEAGNQGSVFLDEVENLPATLQAKLLRVIENRELTRLGSTKPITLNLRFIFGTNILPQELVKAGKMRSDFYYRLDSAPLLSLPDLEERGDDLILLFEYFVDKSLEEFKLRLKKEYQLDKVKNLLKEVAWKGNVRELKNFVSKLILNCTGTSLSLSEIRRRLTQKINIENESSKLDDLLSISNHKEALKEFEKIYLEHHLKLENFQKEKTADKLGMDRTTLYRKLQRQER